jgi:Transposase IS66 family
VRAGDANPDQLTYWAQRWLERIRTLYAAHEELMTAWEQAAAPAPGQAAAAAARLEDARAAWDAAIGAIDAARTKEMAAPGLAEPAKKALATLDREWDGLIAHRDYPMIGLDNNTAERAIRGPVIARKNAGGSRNEDAARLAATFWTVTATAEMAGLNVLTYLTAYLDACGRNGGKPLAGPELDRSCPGKPILKTGTRGHSRLRPAEVTPAVTTAAPPPAASRRRPSACLPTGLPNTYDKSKLFYRIEGDELTRRASPLLLYSFNACVHLIREDERIGAG